MLCPRSLTQSHFRLDKDVFENGLNKLQAKLEERYYPTALAFAHDLCEIVHVGINAGTKAVLSSEPRFEPMEPSPSKSGPSYAEARDRKRLGKRILKSVQPQLETALRAEADITSKEFETLQKELEGMLEASLEVRAPLLNTSRRNGTGGEGQDVEMADVPAEGQIIVRDPDEDEDGEADPDLQSTQEGSGEADADAEGEPDDDMMIDPAPVRNGVQRNIGASPMDVDESSKANGTSSSSVSVAGDGANGKGVENRLPNGRKDPGSPPSLNGYGAALHPPHLGPLTPPQSNGSLGRGQTDVLSEGGVPWYLKGFELEGTTAVEEQWTGRDAVRSLTEELTDMDEEALKDLEFDVDDETITASPVHDTPTTSSAKKRTSPVKFRKGVRSSTRRR